MTSMITEEEESNIIGTSFSLVRYNNPVLIDKHDEVRQQLLKLKSNITKIKFTDSK